MATRPPRVTTPVPAPVIPPHLEEAKAATAIRAVTLDPVLHHRTRLAMVAALAATSTLSFTEMRQLLGLTDGNLSVHARKLEAAGYVATTKSRQGRTSRTSFALTPFGRRTFREYLDHLEALVAAARGVVESGDRGIGGSGDQGGGGSGDRGIGGLETGRR